MTEDVPRELSQYVYKERTRHKKVALYFRNGKGKRFRLAFQSDPSFEEKIPRPPGWLAPAPKRGRELSGSLGQQIELYGKNSAYRRLSYATRRQRDNIFAGIKAKGGTMQLKALKGQGRAEP